MQHDIKQFCTCTSSCSQISLSVCIISSVALWLAMILMTICVPGFDVEFSSRLGGISELYFPEK